MSRKFKDLSEREILALAISLEEEDGRVYADFADGLRETYPATAKLFEEMRGRPEVGRATVSISEGSSILRSMAFYFTPAGHPIDCRMQPKGRYPTLSCPR